MASLTTEMMLEFSGESDLEKVKLLVLRGMGLTTVSNLYLVPSLTSISLSHNDIASISLPAGSLPNLTELNVNRNNLSTLSFLACCPKIQKLFAASNAFTSVSPLAECKELTTVGLHGNEIPDLAPCVAVMQGLPNLQELELDGNPASSHPSYRNVCIGGLDGLRILDGDVVLPKEKEMAKHVAKYEESKTQPTDAETFWTHSDIDVPERSDTAPRPVSSRRPATSHHNASNGNGNGSLRSARLGTSPRPGSAASRGVGNNRPGSALLARSLAGASMSLLEGGSTVESSSVNGLRDEFLNKNPILAEYMAAAEAEEAEEGGTQGEEEDGDDEIRFIDSDAVSPGGGGDAQSAASTRPASTSGACGVGVGSMTRKSKGFATELRQVTGTLSQVEGHSVDEIAAMLADGGAQPSSRSGGGSGGAGAGAGESFGDRVERSLRPLTSGGRGGGGGGRGHGVGKGESETIARLMAELEGYRSGKAVRELEREVKVLRSEAMNMRYLQEENTSLREQVQKLKSAVETDTIAEQNRKLKTMLKNLQCRYRKLSEEAGSYGRPRTAAGQNIDMEMATDLLNEVDGYDAELADLMRRNVVMMSQIKEDLREMGDSSFEEAQGAR